MQESAVSVQRESGDGVLEEELFRYSRRKYSGEKMQSISLHEVHTPQEEAQYVAEEIRRLVREEGYRYREIAVIASDLNTYADLLEGMRTL